jgi:hypothetical protein
MKEPTLEHGGRSDLSVWNLSLSFSRLFLSDIMWYTWLLVLSPPGAALLSCSRRWLSGGATARLLVMRSFSPQRGCTAEDSEEDEGDSEERTAIMARMMAASSSPANGDEVPAMSMERERLDDDRDDDE